MSSSRTAVISWSRAAGGSAPNAPQDREVTVAVSNAFGFGGHNTCVVFKAMDA